MTRDEWLMQQAKQEERVTRAQAASKPARVRIVNDGENSIRVALVDVTEDGWGKDVMKTASEVTLAPGEEHALTVTSEAGGYVRQTIMIEKTLSNGDEPDLVVISSPNPAACARDAVRPLDEITDEDLRIARDDPQFQVTDGMCIAIIEELLAARETIRKQRARESLDTEHAPKL